MAWIFGAFALSGCLLPEFDTPPLDPSLVQTEPAGGGGAGATACSGTFKGSLTVAGDELPASYQGECTIQGNLTVNLDGEAYKKLTGLQAVTGAVTLSANTDKADGATVLPALQSTRDLVLNGTKLATSPRFPALTTLTGKLEIRNNPRLHTLVGFDALRQAARIWVYGNKLSKWSTFGQLEDATGNITVEFEGALDQVRFPAAQSFSGYFKVENCGVHTIDLGTAVAAATVIVSKNPNLKTVRATKLRTVSSLEIGHNAKLTDASMVLGQITRLFQFKLLNQGFITKLTWLGAAPKLEGQASLVVCDSGLSSQSAQIFFEQYSKQVVVNPCP